MSESHDSGWPPPPPPEPGFEPVLPPAAGPAGPPWETAGPWFTRMIDTIRLGLVQPGVFFRTMTQTGGLGPPLVFYLITGAIGAIFTAAYQLMIQGLGGTEEAIPANVVFMLTLVMLPALLVVAVFVGSGIYHLMLMLLGGATRSYETTFRVVAYSGGVTALISVIPVCGGFIGAIWQVVLVIIGLAETHRISTGKAAAAVLLPVAICCLLLVLVVVSIGMAALATLWPR